jgi:hypothetical protein
VRFAPPLPQPFSAGIFQGGRECFSIPTGISGRWFTFSFSFGNALRPTLMWLTGCSTQGLPIKPGIVKVKLNVNGEMARTMLANSITMTPGTITIDIIDDYIYIHWIYVSSHDAEVYSQKICGRFEKYIRRIFE